MKHSGVHHSGKILAALTLSLLLATAVYADTIHLIGGQTYTGEIVAMDDQGIVLKQADGSYTEHLPWAKLMQQDLRDLQQNPKAAQFVEPFIELTQEDKAKRTEIDVKDYPRLRRATGHSLIGGMFSSAIGLFMLLVLYAGNLYAAYEISIFRARPAALVCGVSAVAPLLGPIIFLSMPPQLAHPPPRAAPEWKPPAEEYADTGVAAAIAADQAAEQAAIATAASTSTAASEPGAAAPASSGLHLAASAAPAVAPTKSFLRGQYTFNRRFFETQMPAFFGVVRSGADKDMVLSIRSARGTHVGNRISRISAIELHLQVDKGQASEEVVIPFVEIQEVLLKHKDA
jgi:hypothetical protein